MSWYEEAAKAMGDDCIDIHYDYDSVLGSAHVNVEKVAAIIAKHDPNRWIPVTEAAPKGNAYDDVELYDPLCQRPQRMTTGMYAKSLRAGVNWAQRITHWRPIVLPEVKG